MGDRKSKKDESLHAEKLLRICQSSPVELRDEVYAQIIKQVSGNPDKESIRLGWQLMAICSGAITPSKDFEEYLMAFISRHISGREGAAADLDSNVSSLALYSLARLARTVTMPTRLEVPVLAEIEATRMQQPVMFRVYHLDGSYDTLPVASWVTQGLLKKMVCEKRGIFEGGAFAIFEFQPEGDERLLNPDERVVELVSYWQRLSEEEKGKGEDSALKKAKKKGVNATHSAVFKVHHYFEPKPEDTAAAHEMFIQACS